MAVAGEQMEPGNVFNTILHDILERLRGTQDLTGRVSALETAMSSLRGTADRLETKVEAGFLRLADEMHEVRGEALKAFSPEAAEELATLKAERERAETELESERAKTAGALKQAKDQTRFVLQLTIPALIGLLATVTALVIALHP